jgi:ubiquinone/menaquinone biosynthesis C-methylase UbiE
MVKVIKSRDGYNLYSENYKNDYKELDSFDRKEFMSFIPSNNGICVELGVGDGRISRDLMRKSDMFIGMDIAESMLVQARKNLPGSYLVHCDLEKEIPIKSTSVDLVVAAFFFVHIHRPDYVIAEVERILKPGGTFVFNLIPQRRELVLKAKGNKFKVKSYYHSPPKIEKELKYHWFDYQVETIEGGKTWFSKVYKAVKPE